ncbi:D-alanyl-D-alanine carboxypeptidase/D-alanyl-D-alanine-endopeptidase [Cellulomonas sp. P22]|uniref:D-alanyl-D-alanine carboxypeptidase/D-alanyl-D-alanine endopeptidase n=1 Tax=Cellulomonas sp. P22 TaxID=3373189 RepID=UPI0037B7466A
MPAAVRVAATSALVLVLATGGYATADALDVVPGVLTLAPVPAPAAPFPEAPGAVVGPEVGGVLGVLDATAPVPDAAVLQAKVDALVADARLGASVGVVLVDQLTGEVLAEHSATTGHTPASTAKVVTAAAALSRLGAGATLETRAVRGTGDQVVLVGGGDVMLAAGAGDPAATNGRAGLADLADQTAAQLTLAGLTTVTLAVDDSLFSGPAVSPAWSPSDLTNGFVAPVTAIEVDIASLTDAEYPPRAADPSVAAAKQLATLLAERGITVTGTPTRATASAGAAVLGTVSSAPMGDIVDYFLHSSDNTVTEAVARLVAVEAGLPGSFEGASVAVLRAAAALGVDTTGAVLVDASGLGDGSALPPRMLAGLLQVASDPAHPELRRVMAGLPVAGLSGTLSDRYTTSSARGMVRAKTGSLTGVTALAGTVVDADGRQLVFVVVADQTPPGQWGPRAAIDAFVTDLAACGCS